MWQTSMNFQQELLKIKVKRKIEEIRKVIDFLKKTEKMIQPSDFTVFYNSSPFTQFIRRWSEPRLL